MLGLSIPSFAYRQTTALAVRIAALFRANEQGVWYDPSDRATLFQDASGTTPITGVEQPVGLMLDKSGRGNHAFQSTSASRPVLSARVNQYVGTATLATQNVTTLAATYTLRFEGTGSITLSGTATGTYSAGTHSVVCTAGTLTSTVTDTVTNADIRVANVGVGLPVYQIVTTSTDYDTVSYPFFLRFDGVDDFLVTNSIDFTATDKMTVAAGVRTLASSVGVLAELSASVASSQGTFYLSTLDNFSAEGAALRLTDAPVSFVGYTPSTRPVTYVASIAFDASTNTYSDQIKYRANTTPIVGTDVTTATGPRNFTDAPLYIGRRGGTSVPFNGHLYSLVVRGAASTDSQIAATEKWTNQKTKAYA